MTQDPQNTEPPQDPAEPVAKPVVKLFDWRILPLAGVTCLVLYVLISKVSDLQSLGQTILNAQPAWLAAALGILTLQLLLGTYRMNLAIGSMGYKIPFLRGLDAVLSTWPLALITPSRASDVLRAWVLRDLCPVAECSGAIVAEKMIDVQSLCLLSIIGALIVDLPLVAGIAALLLAAEWAFVLGVVTSGLYTRLPLLKNKSEKLGRLLAVFHAFRENPRYFFGVSATSIIAWMMAVGMLTSLSRAFQAPVAYLDALALWPISIFAGMLPVTVAGMGTRDAAFVGLLELYRQTGDDIGIVATTMTYSVVSAILLAVVGIPFMLRQFRAWFKR